MADVIVRRCTLRIARDGGWSWGPKPEQLVEAALQALPDLLAAAVAELEAAGVADLEIATPVRLSADLRPAHLRTGGERGVREAFARDVRGALRRAVADPVAEPSAAGGGDGIRDAPPARPRREAGPTARDLTVAWLAAGTLDRVLDLFDDEALAAWEEAVSGRRPEHPPARRQADPEALRLVEDVLRDLPVEPGRSGRLRARIALAAATAAHRADWQAASALVDAALPLSPDPTPGAVRPTAPDVPRPTAGEAHAGTAGRAAPSGGSPVAAPGSSRAVRPPAPAAAGPVMVRALPFLVLVPLDRLGYLDLLTASLDAARLSSGARAFAHGLAHKLLDPPQRGWHRTAAASAAATAFAGGEVASGEVTGLARCAPRFASALDALLAVQVLAGRGRAPLILRRSAGGDFVLIDPAGVFLVAVTGAIEPLCRVVRAAGRPPVRPGGGADTRAVRNALEADGIPVVQRRGTWAARRQDDAAERVDAVVAAIEERRAVPLAQDAALERSLGLAAAVGLGSIAWALWREDMGTDPLLALDRLGDLEASVTFEPDRVRVRLPLGRRHRDLLDAGMLGDVGGAGWLDGRRVEISA